MRTIYPPAYPGMPLVNVLFLAGPIQGAPDWQSEAERLVADRVQVANPRRAFTPDSLVEQVKWETHWLQHAASRGAIMFWLANQATEHPERVYAQTTRFELGEWLAQSDTGSMSPRVVVGIDTNFPGASYIRIRIACDYPHVPVLDSLGDTVEAAVLSATTILCPDCDGECSVDVERGGSTVDCSRCNGTGRVAGGRRA